jgi:ferrochelatase
VKTGVLLVNLGTPDAPTAAAVRRYLRALLSDRRVVDAPRVLWLPILYLFILPLRPRVVVKAYAKIWTPEGSPLLAISMRQARALEAMLSAASDHPVPVRAGMVCGDPSILSALRGLRDDGCSRIVVLPLYPQYSSPTVGSAGDVVAKAHATDATLPPTRFVDSYHDHPLYIEALATSARRFWAANGKPQHLLLSFHGMPQRFVDNGDPYEKQCIVTARLVADTLQLADKDWTMTFQSRFGREPWLQPYTNETLRTWGAQGRHGVDVMCPGFAADCLETLEEIAMQNRHFFEAAGGRDFRYIPALNDNAEHIEMMAGLVRPLLQPSN